MVITAYMGQVSETPVPESPNAGGAAETGWMQTGV